MFNDTCDLNNPCCSKLSCIKSDPTQLSGRCYNTNNPDTRTTSNRLHIHPTLPTILIVFHSTECVHTVTPVVGILIVIMAIHHRRMAGVIIEISLNSKIKEK